MRKAHVPDKHMIFLQMLIKILSCIPTGKCKTEIQTIMLKVY